MFKRNVFERIRTEIAVGAGLLVFLITGLVMAQTMSAPATPMAQPEYDFTPTSSLTDRSTAGEQVLAVYVDDEVLYESTTSLSREEANDTCTRYAFDAEYMWQPVKCVWGDLVIYHDVFVAG